LNLHDLDGIIRFSDGKGSLEKMYFLGLHGYVNI